MTSRNYSFCLALAGLLAWLCPVESHHLRHLVFGPDIGAPFHFRLLVPQTLLFILKQTGWSLKDVAPVFFGLLNFALLILCMEFAEKKLKLNQPILAPCLIFVLMLGGKMVFPWDTLGAIFFLTLSVAILDRNFKLWWLLFPISILNRETAICLIPAALIIWGRVNIRSAAIHAIASVAVWFAIKGLLFNVMGGASFGWDNLSRNLDIWPQVFFAFKGLWVVALFGILLLETDLKIIMITIPVYATAMLFFGAFDEPRIWTDLFPVVLPAILAGLGAKPKGVEA